jgi:hypothetical protein
MRRLFLLVALSLSAPSAFAQSEALSAVLNHLNASRAALSPTADDLSEVAVTDEYVSSHSGVTHLYLRQKVGGIEVYNGRVSAHVTPAGRVVGLHSSFVPSAAARAATTAPTLTVEAAVSAAAAQLGLDAPDALTVLEPADESHRMLLNDGGISLEPIPAQLVYFATQEGALRLAWDIAIYQLDARHWWSLRVDAETGAILDKNDWVVNDEWGVAEAGDAALTDPLPASPTAGRSASGSYNVWALPLESPSHGARGPVANPHLEAASPLGWHDTGTSQYTITRGNNVWAYEDRDANNRAGYSPDGGADLVFDFPYDPSQLPTDYQDLAITNLFYWNNIVHDVLYHYGFDEAAGNFQQTNFTGEGLGADYVQAEAQDGSGTNNANFGTPRDGLRPRMQMFVWDPGSEFVITAPESIAREYPNGDALFGGQLPTEPMAYEVVPAVSRDGGDYPNGEEDLDLADRGCEEFTNPDEVAGKIALIERGDCAFAEKAWNAQQAGAIGAIIHNNSRNGEGETGSPEEISNMTADQASLDFDLEDLTIWAIFVQQSTAVLIVDNPPVEGYARVFGVQRDSDFDNGVIAHEYGHGVSNRLTGGPSAAGCLSNTGTQEKPDGEQMGEGWSDYLALMLTMTEENTPEAGRGIGTYLNFEDPDSGSGIRSYPYSTSMSTNPLTYNNIAGESIPHGVGAIWANMLWEMTWNIIAEEGFDPDLVTGTGGNNIALQLVMDGMKLQPCNPGFVDGRDAILTADTLLHDGAYSDEIWRAFAKRGLGYSANQGSSDFVDDGQQAFDLPPGVFPVANEGDALPGVYALSAAYPNPFSDRARFTLEVAEAQDVRVTVYDVMGREVARLHDGLLAAGTRHGFELDGRSLASGVYLIRVAGERFTDTQRVTFLR